MTRPNIPPNGMIRIQEKGKNPGRRIIRTPPERFDHSHLHDRLVPQEGGIQKEDGGMDEEYVGTLQRPKENTTSETDLPVQDLGHIQHTCEALSEDHTAAHHRCWRLFHGELARLASAEWRFMCISGEKTLDTIWKELTEEFDLTGDWFLTEGESRDKLGEWLKKSQVRYQDQRRMLKSIMHCFPSNFWRNKNQRKGIGQV